jgi:hypothetical protein
MKAVHKDSRKVNLKVSRPQRALAVLLNRYETWAGKHDNTTWMIVVILAIALAVTYKLKYGS